MNNHKNKSKEEQEIIDNINTAISELVYEKTQVIKAYNYYHGKRDPEQFKHLEENYGIGTATSVEFIPLVRKHIDVLIGEYLGTTLLPKISCKDKETLSNINRDKQLKIHNDVVGILNKHLKSAVYASIGGKPGATDSEIQQEIDGSIESNNRNFISEYEIAAQNIVDWTMQSRIIDFANKRKILLTDLLIGGMCYYKTLPSPSKTNVNLKILNPLNTFIDRNPESPYLKDSARSVVREYLTVDQILVKYGEYLKPEDLETLQDSSSSNMESSSTAYLTAYDTITDPMGSDGVVAGYEVTPAFPFGKDNSKNIRLFPVYEVEWLKAEKEKGQDSFTTNRHEGVRIGSGIFIPTGKSENVSRSLDDPQSCALTVNGMFYNDRNGDPWSMILSTVNLQDKFDVLHFYRDNIIAESGTAGDWVDIAFLPKVLGSDLTERLMKWTAYKKQGKALIDSSQEGNAMNTMFGGFDDTVKLSTIQAIDLAIQRVEETTSTITGVFKEKLGGIEQKDAVTNVKVGVQQSFLITKQYYQVMDLMTREMLLDILNLAKIVYKKGITGTLILGERLNKIFTALPKYYTMTDHDIHIADSTDIMKEQETMKGMTMEFIKGGIMDPQTILEMVTATGLTKMKEDVITSMEKKKKESNELGQLNQQVQQLDKQLKETTSAAEKLQAEVQKLNADKMQLEKDRLQFEKELEWYKAKTLNSFNEEKLKYEGKRVQLEGAQLLDANHQNDEVRNN